MKNRKRGMLPDTFGAYVLNNVVVTGKYDIPVVGYFGDELPDYLALYSNVQDYRKTKNTCVSFFQFDDKFDSIYGIWNAIISNNEKLQKRYIERFENVKFVVCPDYSITGDMPKAMQIFNVFRSRVVAIWLREKCGCTIIPNLRFNNSKSYDFCFDGIAYNSVVCLSILGLCSKPIDVQNLINGLHEAIIRIRPKTIILFGMCKDKKFNKIFTECIENNIRILRPETKDLDYRRTLYGLSK